MPTSSAGVIRQVSFTLDSSETTAAVAISLVLAATLYALFR